MRINEHGTFILQKHVNSWFFIMGRVRMQKRDTQTVHGLGQSVQKHR